MKPDTIELSDLAEIENMPKPRNGRFAVYALTIGLTIASLVQSGCAAFKEYMEFRNDPDHPCKTGALQQAKYSHPSSAECVGFRNADAYRKGRDYNTGRPIEHK